MSGGDGPPTWAALIPGLPGDVAAHILTLIPYSHHARLRPTCRSWLAFLSPPALLPRRRRSLPPTSLSHLLCIFPSDPFLSPPYLFDPSHRPTAWSPLPAFPCRLSLYGLSNFAALSLGPRLFVLGGALFDARSFPIDRPRPSPAVFSLDLSSPSPAWLRRSPMLHPRAGFACAAVGGDGAIIVAGGGSRHHLFGADGGSRLAAAEMYDAGRDRWAAVEGMPAVRAGCTGFMVGKGEFWVVGGYGDCRTISGVFPVDEYYRDGVVLDLEGGGWRETGEMWAEGQRWRLESVVSIDDLEGPGRPGIFMLDGDDIFR